MASSDCDGTDHQSPEQKDRNPRLSSLRLIVVLLVALAVVAFFPSRAPRSEAEAGRFIDRMTCRIATDGRFDPAIRQVTLPLSSGSDVRATNRQFDCHADLTLTRAERSEAALLIPSFAEVIELRVNDHPVATAEVHQLRTVRYSTLPALFPLQQVARVGTNRIEIRVSSKFGRDVMLDRVRVGSWTQLKPIYSRRWLVAATLPTMTSGAALALALLFGAIWWNRRKERAYGWLAMLLLFAGQHGSILIPDFLPPSDRALWALSTLWAVSANVMFVRRLFDMPNRPGEWLIFLPPLVISLFMIVAPRSFVLMVVLPGATIHFMANMIYAAFLLARAGLYGHREAQFFLLVESIVLGIAIQDVLISAHVISHAQFYSRLASGIFLFAPVTLMIRRKTQAMNEVDRTAATLSLKVIEIEQELQYTYETLREQRDALLIAQERSRMMRDLHDGMSGDIVSMIALAERSDPDVPQIASHARNALADMRLMISSLEDYGGDLSLALGVWRERMEPQVRAAAIRLAWFVDDLPPQGWLGPSHVLDILRILQEAVTNAVRHSGARVIQMDCRLEADAIRVVIGDDGCGRPSGQPPSGRGLANMKARAARLGAGLEIVLSPSGTRVNLSLPLRPAEASAPPLHDAR